MHLTNIQDLKMFFFLDNSYLDLIDRESFSQNSIKAMY